jgi:hypothetical protein
LVSLVSGMLELVFAFGASMVSVSVSVSVLSVDVAAERLVAVVLVLVLLVRVLEAVARGGAKRPKRLGLALARVEKDDEDARNVARRISGRHFVVPEADEGNCAPSLRWSMLSGWLAAKYDRKKSI